jgi:hypothetical protein
VVDEKIMENENNNWKIYSLIFVPIVVFVLYAGALLWLTWPISEVSINKSGIFGDSFGALTALFSGLAFAGMIVTILLQSRELQLQRQEISQNRTEFQRSAGAQEKSARLLALSTLLEEYKYRLKLNDESLDRTINNTKIDSTRVVGALQKENLEIIKKRDGIIRELEDILSSNAKT